MRKLVFVLLCISTLAQADITYVLLDYEYGNQITRSKLTVLNNGLVMAARTLQGRTTRLPDEILSPKDLTALNKNINDAAMAPQARLVGDPTALGSQSGKLIGYTQNGGTAYIIVVSRNTGPGTGNPDNVIFQKKQATIDVIKFVNSRVQNQISQSVLASCEDALKTL